MSLPVAGEAGEAFAELSRMRGEFYACLTVRGDELFELTDAMLCAQGAVRSIPELTLTPEHRRGHGALYDGLNAGRIDVDRLRNLLSRTKLPRFPEGRLVLAVDVSAWLRSDAACSPDRLFCHVYGRAKSASQFIPGWPYSFVAVLEPGASSWTQILDAVRLGPEDDATAVTAAQLRQVVQRLIAAGQWRDGDPDILIVADAGYDVCRLGWVLADLPVELVGRLRSDRVMQLPKPVRAPGTNGRPPKHGPQFRFTDPGSWPEPAVTTITATSNYGKALTQVLLAAKAKSVGSLQQCCVAERRHRTLAAVPADLLDHLVGRVEQQLQLGPGQCPALRAPLDIQDVLGAVPIVTDLDGMSPKTLLALDIPPIERLTDIGEERANRQLVGPHRRQCEPAHRAKIGRPLLEMLRCPLPRELAGVILEPP
ncbi:transposase [Nocardia australiensis]|uniref:transposase n=1 Tax=Nocardia australiensis TaxID=2887191 RepID=UPI001D14317D|nr:transposase [Nocardia australiensis]